jgi:hypothetical protein
LRILNLRDAHTCEENQGALNPSGNPNLIESLFSLLTTLAATKES